MLELNVSLCRYRMSRCDCMRPFIVSFFHNIHFNDMIRCIDNTVIQHTNIYKYVPPHQQNRYDDTTNRVHIDCAVLLSSHDPRHECENAFCAYSITHTYTNNDTATNIDTNT